MYNVCAMRYIYVVLIYLRMYKPRHSQQEMTSEEQVMTGCHAANLFV